MSVELPKAQTNSSLTPESRSRGDYDDGGEQPRIYLVTDGLRTKDTNQGYQESLSFCF